MKKKNKISFSKIMEIQESVLIWITTISLIVLAYVCVFNQYFGELPWITAMCGFPWTAYGVTRSFHLNKSKAENTANETEIQNLVNIAISRVKAMEGNMTRLNKVGIDMVDALLNGTRARKDKKAIKENNRIADELKNRSFEKSNRRFGSFRRYSR